MTRINPLTGKTLIRSRRHVYPSAPSKREGYITFPVGNLLGAFSFRPVIDDLLSTVQSTVLEIRIEMVIDGVPVPVVAEVEAYSVEQVA